jgi:bifunctional non-homologous end joining protein LigD
MARTPFPPFIPPALATMRSSAPAGSAFVHEVKLDGYRLQAHIQGGQAILFTRSGLDWTHRFGNGLASAFGALPVRSAIIDGEVTVEGADGLPSFPALQDALAKGRHGRYLVYAFDLLYLNGRDLRELPLLDRKAMLAALIPEPGILRYSEHFDDGIALFRQACAIGLEGVISKRGDAPYRSGRGRDWFKVKCLLRQEFVIAGYVPLKGLGKAVGSLVLGYYEGDKLVHAGRAGTGFTEQVAVELFERLETMRTLASPFTKRLSRAEAKDVRYVRPELVAEIAYRGWSSDNLVRQSSFRGLREDKTAREVTLDAPLVRSSNTAP